MENKKRTADFYDAYAGHQESVAFNERHRHLYECTKKLGLRASSAVLDLGCGVGVMSALLLRTVTQGNYTAVDLSPKSIEAAKKRCAASPNAEFITADVCTFSRPGARYDFVTLFDVMEHIPGEEHDELIGNVAAFMHADSKLLINIPFAPYLRYAMQHFPERMQELEVPIASARLGALLDKHGLELLEMRTYGVWQENEYQLFIAEKKKDFMPRPLEQESFFRRLKRKFAG